MSDPTRRISLEQLRKQAKERLKARRLTDPSATLASVQFALARELGYESWPRLVHALGPSPDRLGQFEEIARQVLAGAGKDSVALEQLSEFTGSSYNLEQLHIRVVGWLTDAAGPRENGDWSLDDACKVVARKYGFDRWEDLTASLTDASGPAGPARQRAGLFFEIDWERKSLELRPPIRETDWDYLADLIEDTGITEVTANGQMTDPGLARLSRVEQLTRLNFDGSQRISEEGLAHLAQMPQLEELDLSGMHVRYTDRGLSVLSQLPRLRIFRACWSQRISDAGIGYLTQCRGLERVDLMGTQTGDGAVAALAGMEQLVHLKTGRLLTDAGVQSLHQLPAFRRWAGRPARYGLMEFDAGPTFLLLDGPVTDEGIRALAGLDGLFALGLFWHMPVVTSAGLAALASLPNLGQLGCQDALCDDTAMRHIGTLPKLRMLMAQGTVAGDEGFRALSRSTTLEHIWGRDSLNLGSKGLVALASMPSMRGLALSLAGVDDSALASLADMPALTELVPMNVQDDAFRHVGRCRNLERLWCMYCRDTGDQATEQLANLPRLRTYYAGKTRITDRSLEVLGGIRSLEELEFWETARITDEGLSHLASLPRLQRLEIAGAAGITREGLKRIPSRVRVRYHG